MKFPKTARLLTRGQFQKILREGRRLTGRVVSIQYMCKVTTQNPKLGVTISKKFGKSHIRNRFKRVVREAFREISSELPSGLELHVLPRTPPLQIKKQDVLLDLRQIQSKITIN